jgi:hypothetical protein
MTIADLGLDCLSSPFEKGRLRAPSSRGVKRIWFLALKQIPPNLPFSKGGTRLPLPSYKLLAAAALATLMFANARADEPKQYPAMAPIAQYLMDRDAEIELAKSAAFPTIANDAKVLVLTKTGYETAVQGTNGFVCMVERSWHSPEDDPEFWNPTMRGPICFNSEAVRTQTPISIKKTDLILANPSREKMIEGIKTAFAKKELTEPEPGAMCYMLSAKGHLNDHDGHWRPHLMFFVPLAEPKDWGANIKGSPVYAAPDPLDRRTIFMVPVAKWSDGTPAPAM